LDDLLDRSPMTPVAYSEIDAYRSPILVYHGSCGFCSRSVQFMLRHERRHDLLFVTRDSELGQRLRRAWGLESVQSMLWIEGGQVFAKSGAVIKAAAYLGGWWSRLAALGSFGPSFILNRRSGSADDEITAQDSTDRQVGVWKTKDRTRPGQRANQHGCRSKNKVRIPSETYSTP
jgi:predicted DCC family thiol-disulfide oxidoreductase YuxK